MLRPGCLDAGRTDGYAPIRDYAVIGDGRTVALVAADGSIDWLCVPDLDSPAVFGALLDARKQGDFTLSPEEPFEVTRRYVAGTNVLQTTFRTASGTVRITDAMTLPGAVLCPQREVVRVVEGLTGSVDMCWEVMPRFGFGSRPTQIGYRGHVPVATHGADAMAVCSWGAGRPLVAGGSISGRFEATVGSR
ncbi:MAG TPA: trehalase-like domain-containing protein, partial [Mycobacteriales bacterium]